MIPVEKDAITMADQFLTPGWYLQPGGWPYWIANGLAAFAPRNDAWIQNLPSSDSKGGILGMLAEPTASLDRSKSSLGGISRRARSIRREPSFRHSLLAADGRALQRGSRSATTAERPAPASRLTTSVEFAGAIQSVRAAIHRFRFERSLLATDSSAARRK